MQVRIYQPTKTAMQSVNNSHKNWVLEFEEKSSRYVYDVMGWKGNTDMQQEILLKFQTMEEAINFAVKAHLNYEVIMPKTRHIIPKSYASNFN